jgi:catechol-2,3-dioxygenase
LKEEEMKPIPSGTELTHPFMPGKDFAISKNFYETLGFEKLLDGDAAIFRAGSGGFILQRHQMGQWKQATCST